MFWLSFPLHVCVCILALYDLKFIKFQINELFVDTLSSQLLILCLYNCGYSVFTIVDTLSLQLWILCLYNCGYSVFTILDTLSLQLLILCLYNC